MSVPAHRLAATLLAAVFAGSALTTVAPAVAAPSACVKTVLPVPAGSPAGTTTQVRASDDTGRYQVGYVTPPGAATYPVLWDNLQPKRLNLDPAFDSSVTDVNSAGVVLGSTETFSGERRPWVYRGDSYEYLPAPAGYEFLSGSSINNGGDVVGNGLDNATNRFTAIVWPVAGAPRALAGATDSNANEITDSGAIVGNGTVGDLGRTGVYWESSDVPGRPITGPDGITTGLQAIRGPWILGFRTDESFTPALWNLTSTEVVTPPGLPRAMNSSGDIATILDSGELVVERRDGSRYQFPEPTRIVHLTDEGNTYDAAGQVTGPTGTPQAALWSGCS